MSQFHNFGLPVRLENKIDDRTKKNGKKDPTHTRIAMPEG